MCKYLVMVSTSNTNRKSIFAYFLGLRSIMISAHQKSDALWRNCILFWKFDWYYI